LRRLSSLHGVVNPHLHFDHCGNNRLFPGTPIFVQRAEYEAASAPHYTVPSWLHFERADYRLVGGSHRLSGNVEIIATPGHTPGHQSVLIRTELGLQLVVAQAAYTSAGFARSRGSRSEACGDAWSSQEYAESLSRLHALQPVRAFFSHDATSWRSAA
jgi:glyoxylase-like metal-dependent hydrolase (beta-lactamase superfamily II)